MQTEHELWLAEGLRRFALFHVLCSTNIDTADIVRTDMLRVTLHARRNTRQRKGARLEKLQKSTSVKASSNKHHTQSRAALLCISPSLQSCQHVVYICKK